MPGLQILTVNSMFSTTLQRKFKRIVLERMSSDRIHGIKKCHLEEELLMKTPKKMKRFCCIISVSFQQGLILG